MPYVEKLKALKEEKGLTNAEIATLSNLPLATITRIFNGTTLNPTFETIIQIAIALGTTPDEIIGLREQDEPPIPSRIENTLNSYSELLKEKDDRIRELKDSVEKQRKEKNMLQSAFVVFVAFVLIIFTIYILYHRVG